MVTVAGELFRSILPPKKVQVAASASTSSRSSRSSRSSQQASRHARRAPRGRAPAPAAAAQPVAMRYTSASDTTVSKQTFPQPRRRAPIQPAARGHAARPVRMPTAGGGRMARGGGGKKAVAFRGGRGLKKQAMNGATGPMGDGGRIDGYAGNAGMAVHDDGAMYGDDGMGGAMNGGMPEPTVVLDGRDIGRKWGHKRREVITENIVTAMMFYEEKGREVVTILPHSAIEELADPYALVDYIKDGSVVFTPNCTAYNDYLLSYSGSHQADLVSNQSFREEFAAQEEEDRMMMHMWLAKHLIPFVFVQDNFHPNPDHYRLHTGVHAARGQLQAAGQM